MKYVNASMDNAVVATRQLPLSNTAMAFLLETKAEASAQSSSIPVLTKNPSCEEAPNVVTTLQTGCQ